MKSEALSSVYLAGGFKSGWQDLAASVLRDFFIYDPSKHNLSAPSDYTRWDLAAIEQSDIVLAYMEPTNPGGYALALEVGYARALGKYIVLVDCISDPLISRHFEMVRQCSDAVYRDLESAYENIKNRQRAALHS